jgi:hypothetical protein
VTARSASAAVDELAVGSSEQFTGRFVALQFGEAGTVAPAWLLAASAAATSPKRSRASLSAISDIAHKNSSPARRMIKS